MHLLRRYARTPIVRRSPSLVRARTARNAALLTFLAIVRYSKKLSGLSPPQARLRCLDAAAAPKSDTRPPGSVTKIEEVAAPAAAMPCIGAS